MQLELLSYDHAGVVYTKCEECSFKESLAGSNVTT